LRFYRQSHELLTSDSEKSPPYRETYSPSIFLASEAPLASPLKKKPKTLFLLVTANPLRSSTTTEEATRHVRSTNPEKERVKATSFTRGQLY